MANFVQLVKDAFFNEIERNESSERWVLDPMTNKPMRQPQSNIHRATRRKTELEIVDVQPDGSWVVTRASVKKAIILTQNVVERVLQEWEGRSDHKMSLGTFKSQLTNRYEGLRIEDLNFIFKTHNKITGQCGGSSVPFSRETSHAPSPCQSSSELSWPESALPSIKSSPSPEAALTPGSSTPSSSTPSPLYQQPSPKVFSHPTQIFVPKYTPTTKLSPPSESASMSNSSIPRLSTADWPYLQPAPTSFLPLGRVLAAESISDKTGTPPAELIEVPYLGTPTHPTQQKSGLNSAAAYWQQKRLFDSPRTDELLATYRKIKATNSKSHLNKLGKLALEILENGRPAVCWTPGDDENLMEGADYLLLTEEQHLEFAQAGEILKPVVVRDENFRKRRPGISRDSMFKKLLNSPPWRKVAVQKLETLVDDSPVKPVEVAEAVRMWRDSPFEFSDTNPPLNMLDLSNSRERLVLSGLCNEYTVMTDACEYSDSEMIFHLSNKEQQTGVGKATVEFWSAADLKNCMRFLILAQRGAISAWHMDNCGVSTWVMLEGNTDDLNERDEDVLKFWCLFPFDELSDEDKARHLWDFGQQGPDWRPRLDRKYPILSLIKGDTLIMPPGTIHAPITVTDCLFSGGMCMHPKAMKRSIEVWHYLHKNYRATNEPAPKQSRTILDYIKNLVLSDPTEYGFTPDELGEFVQTCTEISNATLSCRCTGGCQRALCNCLKYGQRCGAACHNNVICKNPFGCEHSHSLVV